MNQNDLVLKEFQRDGYVISNDPARLDLDFLHDFLGRKSYWARGIPREIIERSLRNSLCFGVYHGPRQVGFARVVSDLATFAYLADVFVDEAERGHGLGIWLMECIMAHPNLQNLRRFMLGTKDAHGLYRKFGFAGLKDPAIMMEIWHQDIYTNATAQTGANA